MATARHPRAAYKSNWNKYDDSVNDVARREVTRAFLWLYQGGSQYVGDYLKDLKTKNEKKNLLNKSQKTQLENKDPVTSMDISLLYILMQHTCGLSTADDPIWINPDPCNTNNLEHTLYQIKEERNICGHEKQRPSAIKMSYAELKIKIDKLRWLCCNVLSEAGRLSGRLSEITKYSDALEADLRSILGINSERFVQLAREEKQRRIRKTAGEGAAGCSVGYLPPLVRREGSLVELKVLLQLWAQDTSAPDIILVTGDAGAGKTSLSRYFDESWAEEWKDSLCDVCVFDLVLLVCCRDVDTRDVAQLLRDEVLPETASWCDPYTLLDILSELKILWILDGLDERTPEAAKLLETLVERQAKGSLIMVTSRPEHSTALTARFMSKRILIVTLCGVDPEAMIKRLQNHGDPDRRSLHHVSQLIEYLKKLDKEVKEELQNPLKMQLLLEDLENMKLTHDKGFDLSRLYQKHKDTQLQRLVEKFTNSHITERSVTRKVNKWFLVLCKVAFDRVQELRVSDYRLCDPELRKLEDKCDDLGLSSSECLSTFLSHPNNSSPDRPKYSFFHGTQQHFLAAMYVSSIIEESKDITDDLCKLFGIVDMKVEGEEESHVHSYEVLLQLVAITDPVGEEKLMTALVQVLAHVIPSDHRCSKWFEVIHRGSYNLKMVQEVSKVMPDHWFVGDCNYEAARHLLQHSEPKQVTLLLNKPNDHSQLVAFLQKLALQPVDVTLCHRSDRLGQPSITGRYLMELCGADSQCVILGLTGCLSYEAYDLLRLPMITDYCQEMSLRVRSTEDLEMLCEIVRDFEFLDKFDLILDISNPPSYTSYKLPYYVNLSLPHVTDESVIAAAKLVSCLSGMYNSITLYKLTDKGARDFVKRLKRKKVGVEMLYQTVTVGRYIGVLEYGPLPLRYPLRDFMWYWRNVDKNFADRPRILKQISTVQ